MDFQDEYEGFSDEEKEQVKNGFIDLLTAKVDNSKKLAEVLLKSSGKIEGVISRINDGENPVEMMCMAGITIQHSLSEVSKFLIEENEG